MRFRSIIVLSGLVMLAPLIAAAQPGRLAQPGQLAQPGRLALPDFSALAKKASQSVNISLGPSLIGLAAGVLSADSNPDDAAVKDLVSALQGVYVRSFTFDRDGAYSKADVDAVRAQLGAPGWVPLVSTHDRQQQTDVDIYLRRSGRITQGMAIIAAQPRKLTIINIVGPIDLAKLAQLQGRFGIPRVNISNLLKTSTQAPVSTAPRTPAQPGVSVLSAPDHTAERAQPR